MAISHIAPVVGRQVRRPIPAAAPPTGTVGRFKSVAYRWPTVHRAAKRAFGAARFLLRSPHEADFAFFANLQGRRGLFVDIGANTGQSARSFRIFNRSFDILSFEPNKLLEPDLRFTRRLIGRQFDYRLCGLGEYPAVASLFVPVVGRTPHTPWATLDRQILEYNRLEIERELGQPFSIHSLAVQIARFDDLGLAPEAVKIDVEGLELSVLRGMEQTLLAHRPIVMFEGGAHEAELLDYLRARGYRTFCYLPRTNVLNEVTVADCTNYFALHERHCDLLAKMLRTSNAA